MHFLDRPKVTKVYDMFGLEPDEVRFYLVEELSRVFDYDPRIPCSALEISPFRQGTIWTYFRSPDQADKFIKARRERAMHSDPMLRKQNDYRLEGSGDRAGELKVVTYAIQPIITTPDKIPENLGGLFERPTGAEIYENHNLQLILQQTL